MGDFFKGWRRKTGVVTLVMALLLLFGWVRGHFVADFILVPVDFSKLTFSSTSDGVGWDYYLNDGIPFYAFTWKSEPRSDHDLLEATWRANIEIAKNDKRLRDDYDHWELCGLRVETLFGQRRIRISYWLIILPLTLFSAFLLLSKPRVAKPKVASEN